MQLFASEVNADYYTCPIGIVGILMLTITYIHIYIYTKGRFNNHTADIVTPMATTVMGVTKMGNIVRHSKPHLWHSGPVYYHYTTQAP